MRVRIHRGAAEIGGNCIEVEADGQRLVLDVGQPLNAGLGDTVDLPAVPGLVGPVDPSLLGVVLSHIHLDHCGLAPKVAPGVTFFLGEASWRILDAVRFFSPYGMRLEPVRWLEDRVPLQVGPFRMTPYLNDHSAFDGYSLLLEAGGERLLYTGDLRAHGRNATVFQRFLAGPFGDVDVLLTEGTVLPDHGAPRTGPDEREVEDAMVETMKSTPGLALVCLSGQNIDRVITTYEAARRAGRELIVDLYTAAILDATGDDGIPKLGSPGLKVMVTWDQRGKIIDAGEYDRVKAPQVKANRVFPDRAGFDPTRYTMVFRSSMIRQLVKADCLKGAACIWSLWSGYLDEPRGQRLKGWLSGAGIPLEQHHASGHASVEDLARVMSAVSPRVVVPVHTFGRDRFARHFPDQQVELHDDGEWWDVRY